MAEPVVTEKHERTIRVAFDRHELKALLVKAALREAGIESVPSTADMQVTFDDVTEGSPAYRVGTSAKVVVTIDIGTPA